MATTAGRISGTRNIRVNEVWAATWIATDPSVPNNTIAPESLGNVNKIFTSNKQLIGLIKKHLGQKDLYHTGKNEKCIMLLCLFCLT